MGQRSPGFGCLSQAQGGIGRQSTERGTEVTHSRCGPTVARGVLRQRNFTARGSWLLLGASALFLLAFRTTATLRRRLPRPPAQSVPQDTEFHTAGVARWSVAALTVVLIGLGLGLYVWVGSPLGSYQQPVASQLPSDAAKTETVTNLAPVSSVKKAESGPVESGGTSLSGAKGVAGEPITPFVPQGVPPHSPTSIDAGSRSTLSPVVLPTSEGIATKGEIAKKLAPISRTGRSGHLGL